MTWRESRGDVKKSGLKDKEEEVQTETNTERDILRERKENTKRETQRCESDKDKELNWGKKKVLNL
jgi:hypothetical protein